MLRRHLGSPWLVFPLAAIVFHALGHNPTVELFGAGDGFIAGLPSKIFSTSLSAWNPWIQLGQYAYANVQSQPFYPPALFFLGVFPGVLGFNLFILAHYAAAGCFSFLFLRNLRLGTFACVFGALLFELGGFLSAHKGHTAILSAAPWLPLVLYSLDRYLTNGRLRPLAIGALAIAMSLLAGFPQITLYLVMLASAYAAYRVMTVDGLTAARRAGRLMVALAVTLGLGGLLAAVQLMPVAASLPQMTRETLSFATFSEDYLPAPALLGLVVPNLFGGLYGVVNYAPNINFVEIYAYMGLLPLALAAGAVAAGRSIFRDTLFWTAVLVAGIVLALGATTPVYRLLYHVPVYNLFRASARHLFEVHFAMSVLAAAAVHAISTATDRRVVRKVVIWAGGVLLAGAGAAVVYSQVLVGSARHVLDPAGAASRADRVNQLYTAGEVADATVRNLSTPQLLPLVFLVLSVGTLWLIWWRPKARATWLVLLAVTLGDLYGVHAFIYQYPDTRPAFHAETRPEIAAFRARGYDPTRERVFPTNPEELYASPLLNILAGVSVINDYSPLWLKRYKAFADFYPNGVLDADRVTDRDLLSVTGARYVITATPHYRDLFRRTRAVVDSRSPVSATSPTYSDWALHHATPEDNGFRFEAATPADVSLVQARIRVQPDTGYLLRFDARSDVPMNRPLRIDLYGGPSYDSVLQEHTIDKLPATFEPQSVVIDSGPRPPASDVYVRIFTQSTLPIHIRGVAVSAVTIRKEQPFEELLMTDDGRTVFENKSALPRFRFAQRLVPVSDVVEAHRLFRAPDFDDTTTVTVEGLGSPETLAAGEIVSADIANSFMRWRIRTPGRAFFVVADSWFPGWQATVDGLPTTIYPTDGFLRGIMIDGAGEHTVEMIFTPPGFALGLAGTTLGLILLALVFKMNQ